MNVIKKLNLKEFYLNYQSKLLGDLHQYLYGIIKGLLYQHNLS